MSRSDSYDPRTWARSLRTRFPVSGDHASFHYPARHKPRPGWALALSLAVLVGGAVLAYAERAAPVETGRAR